MNDDQNVNLTTTDSAQPEVCVNCKQNPCVCAQKSDAARDDDTAVAVKTPEDTQAESQQKAKKPKISWL